MSNLTTDQEANIIKTTPDLSHEGNEGGSAERQKIVERIVDMDSLLNFAQGELRGFTEKLPSAHVIDLVKVNHTKTSLPEAETILIAQEKAEELEMLIGEYKKVLTETGDRLSEYVTTIFSEINNYDPCELGDQGANMSEVAIAKMDGAYFSSQIELEVVWPQEEALKEYLKKTETSDYKNFELHRSQTEAKEAVEGKGTEAEDAVKNYIIGTKNVEEAELDEIMEKSEEARLILDKCVDEIVTQEAHKKMIQDWKENGQWNLDGLLLAIKETRVAHRNKYDSLFILCEEIFHQKEMLNVNKAGGPDLWEGKESNKPLGEEFDDNIPTPKLDPGRESLIKSTSRVEGDIDIVSKRLEIIKHLLHILMVKK